MLPSIARVILCFATLTLIACTSNQVLTQRANDLAACKKVCQKRVNTCQRLCHNNCDNCKLASASTTARHYGLYMKEVCVQGGIVTRDLQSYRDPLQCRKTTCNCWADYHVCEQSCTGVIHKRLQVAPACC